MRKRWLIYIAIGLIFGIVDWYFLDLLASLLDRLGQDESLFEAVYARLLIIAMFMSLNYGIWLVPVVPSAIYEVKRSQSLRKAALAAVVVWAAAILSYYAYYTFLLMFVGLPNLDFMLFSNRQSPTYWTDWWPPFQRAVLSQFIEWIGIAVIGGAVVGAFSAYLYRRSSKRPVSRQQTSASAKPVGD
jgi:hypothetical protein